MRGVPRPRHGGEEHPLRELGTKIYGPKLGSHLALRSFHDRTPVQGVDQLSQSAQAAPVEAEDQPRKGRKLRLVLFIRQARRRR